MDNEVWVLGRLIGICSQQEKTGDNHECVWLADNFKPRAGIDLPICATLFVNYTEGNFEVADKDGTVQQDIDIVDFLKNVPKTEVK